MLIVVRVRSRARVLEDDGRGTSACLGVLGVEAVLECVDRGGSGVVGEDGGARAEEAREGGEDGADLRVLDPRCELCEREVVGVCDLQGRHAGEVGVHEAGEGLGAGLDEFGFVGEHVVSMARDELCAS